MRPQVAAVAVAGGDTAKAGSLELNFGGVKLKKRKKIAPKKD